MITKVKLQDLNVLERNIIKDVSRQKEKLFEKTEAIAGVVFALTGITLIVGLAMVLELVLRTTLSLQCMKNRKQKSINVVSLLLTMCEKCCLNCVTDYTYQYNYFDFPVVSFLWACMPPGICCCLHSRNIHFD